MQNNKILIVDDEPINLMLLEDMLKKEHFSIQTATNGADALEQVASFKPDLILLDIMMSGIDGYEVCKRIRADETLSKIKIVMVSCGERLEERLKGYEVGADDYIIKPFEKEELLAKVKIFIRLKRSENANETYRKNMESLFKSVREGIVMVDNRMQIIHTNEAVESICGVSCKDIIGTNYADTFIHCNRTCQDLLKDVIQNKKILKEYYVECMHHQLPGRVVLISACPLIDAENNLIGAVLVKRDRTEIIELKQALIRRSQFHQIIGKSEVMQDIYSILKNLATTDTTVLITGESGTGKELVASALHYTSSRSQYPFIKVNCSALSESLLESELFGHVKGAFTGAFRDRQGRFHAANRGTIFLDEIGDISPLIQLKLLRVLQEKEFECVGATQSQKVDVRVITATNQNLKEKVKMGEFREDLYYRLKVMEIKLPPLKDRKDDIPLLVDHFIQGFNEQFKKNISGVSNEVMRLFMNNMWPGNIREMQHALEHAFVLCPHSGVISAEFLPVELRDNQTIFSSKKDGERQSRMIIEAMTKCGWNKSKAAQRLGITRPTLYKLINLYDIKSPFDS